MAGVPAGRLSIEIVAEIARLQQDMDRVKRLVGQATGDIVKNAKYANDNLAGIGKGASANIIQFSREVTRLKSQVDPAWASLQKYKQEVFLLSRALREGAISQDQYIRELQRSRTAYQEAGQAVVASTGAQRAGMQQLSYQVGDMATMWAMGAKPMQIFASQSGQVIQAIQLMSNSSKGFIGFLAGPWGIGITAAATVLIPLISRLWETESAANGAKSALQGLIADYRNMVAENNKLSDSQNQLNRMLKERSDLQTTIQQKSRGRFQADGVTPMFAQGEYMKLKQLNWDIVEAQGALATAMYKTAEAENRSTAATSAGNTVRQTSAGSTRSQTTAISDSQRALDQRNTSTLNFITSLQDEIARIGLDEKAIRQLDVARAMETATTDAQRKAIADLNITRENSIRIEEELARIKALQSTNEGILKDIAALEREAQVAKLAGWERERRLAVLTAEAEILPLLTQLADAQLKGLDVEAAKLREQIALRQKLLDARLSAGDNADQWAKEAEGARELNSQLLDMISLLDRIGGAGSVLGSVLAIASGNYNNVASGPLGDLLAFTLNQKGADGKKLGDQIKTSLEGLFTEVFGKNGLFGQTLTQTLQGAGVGLTASRSILGDRGTTGDIGSAIGGAAGQALGNMIAGPIGGMIGSVVLGTIGGFIGGLFGGTPKGSVSFTGSGVTGSNGKGDQLAAATQAANASLQSLSQIADALGGTLANVRGVSLGMKKDDWVLDPTGQGRTKGSGVINFGQDAEAAAMAATKLLIERGVIAGIRNSTQNILRAGGDLETQLAKALAWENLFKEAEAAANPFSSALKELADQFSEISSIAREAKASTEELAQVQALLVQKQQALVDQAMANYRSTFYSDAQNTAFAKQTISSTLTPLGYGNVDTVAGYKALVEATDALANPALFGALMELTDEFGLLQEAADNAKQAAEAKRLEEAALVAQRGQMEVDLLRAQGKEIEAVAKARALELAALDPSLRGLMQEIYAAQDLQQKKDDLRGAYERESAELESTAERMRGFIDTFKDLRSSIYAADEAGSGYASRLADLQRVGRLAAFGDEGAMGQLSSAVREFLPAARANAATLLDYRRAQALAARYVDSATGAAEAGLSEAEQQLAVMKEQVGKLIDINESVLSVAEALSRFAPQNVPVVSDVVRNEREERDRDRQERDRERREERENRRDRTLEQMTVSANKTARILDEWDRGGRMAVADETA